MSDELLIADRIKIDFIFLYHPNKFLIDVLKAQINSKNFRDIKFIRNILDVNYKQARTEYKLLQRFSNGKRI